MSTTMGPGGTVGAGDPGDGGAPEASGTGGGADSGALVPSGASAPVAAGGSGASGDIVRTVGHAAGTVPTVPVDHPEAPHRVVRITARTAIVAVASVVLSIVGLRVFTAAHAPLSWAAAAGVVAVLIDPIVDRLDKRIPRLPAVIIALIVTAAAVWGVVYAAFDDLSSGVDRLGEAAQEAATELEDRDDRVGRLAQDVEASRRVDLFVDALDDRVTGGGDVVASTAGTAPTYFIGGILTLFLLSYGPRVATAAVDQLPDERRRRVVSDVVTSALQRSRRAIFYTVGEGILAGLVVAGVAALLDVPAPAALGLAAGVMALLPHVGLVLGTLPLVLLVLATRSGLATVVVMAVVLTCQLLDSFWLRRRIAGRSVHIGLLVPWVVALVGYAVYGVGGAAYGLAFAVFGLAVLDEVGARRPREPVGAGDAVAGGPPSADGGSTPAEPGAQPATRPAAGEAHGHARTSGGEVAGYVGAE
jgi:predicted PurR-regulated permease PerM